MPPNQKLSIIIIGCGRLGSYLADRLSDHNECIRLARRTKATVVHGDGSDPQILKEAGAATADVVLAVTRFSSHTRYQLIGMS